MKKIISLAFVLLLATKMVFAASYEQLYIVGNASPAGWSPEKAPEMTKVSEGVFTWTGTLTYNPSAPNEERFKFLIARDWHPSITCQIITPGFTMIEDGVATDLFVRETENTGADNAFQVPSSGTYKVDVDLNTMKMTCTKQGESGVDKTQLYMVGNATAADWENNKAVPMVMGEAGVFTWNGVLKVGQLKFLNKLGVWSNSINPIDKTNPSDQSFDLIKGSTYDLNFRPEESSPYDNKFEILSEGEYTLSLNLNSMTMTVGAASSVDKVEGGVSQVIVDNGSVKVIVAAGANVQSAMLYDISGKSISSVAAGQGESSFVVASGLKSGVYIVSTVVNDISTVQKVVVK